MINDCHWINNNIGFNGMMMMKMNEMHGIHFEMSNRFESNQL